MKKYDTILNRQADYDDKRMDRFIILKKEEHIELISTVLYLYVQYFLVIIQYIIQ